MELVLNDLSIHGQFSKVSDFRLAIGRIMNLRRIALRYGREVKCHRNISQKIAIDDVTVIQLVNRALPRDAVSALLQWFTRAGPFWDDDRLHRGDDYLECNGEIVTDTAVGEAAYSSCQGVETGVVSLNPSSWMRSPLEVSWYFDDSGRNVQVSNFWEVAALEEALEDATALPQSWRDWEEVARMRFTNLTFSRDCFVHLRECPYAKSGARALLRRLNVLHELKDCIDREGGYSHEGQGIRKRHFEGDHAWFSDSSDSEKRDFKRELTFRHPAKEGERLFCTWHGKVKYLQLRIHYSSPMRVDEPVYVVYIGPKLTKR